LVNFVLYYLLRGLELALLSPIALIGLLLEILRSLCVKAKRKFKRQNSDPALFSDLLSDTSDLDDIARNKEPYLVAIRLTDLVIRVISSQDSFSDASSIKESIKGSTKPMVKKQHAGLDESMMS